MGRGTAQARTARGRATTRDPPGGWENGAHDPTMFWILNLRANGRDGRENGRRRTRILRRHEARVRERRQMHRRIKQAAARLGDGIRTLNCAGKPSLLITLAYTRRLPRQRLRLGSGAPSFPN